MKKVALAVKESIYATEERQTETGQESVGAGLMKKFHMSYMNSFLPQPLVLSFAIGLHVGGKDHCQGVSMSLASPEAPDIKIHCSSLETQAAVGWG